MTILCRRSRGAILLGLQTWLFDWCSRAYRSPISDQSVSMTSSLLCDAYWTCRPKLTHFRIICWNESFLSSQRMNKICSIARSSLVSFRTRSSQFTLCRCQKSQDSIPLTCEHTSHHPACQWYQSCHLPERLVAQQLIEQFSVADLLHRQTNRSCSGRPISHSDSYR